MKVIKKFAYLLIISGIIGCSSGQGMEKAEENPEKKPEAIKYPITIINASTKNLRAIIRTQAMGIPLADFILKPNGDKSFVAAMDKGLYMYVTNGQGRSYKIYDKAERETTFYLFIPPENLQAWFSNRASRIGKHIDIYLRQSAEENTIVALSDSENSKIFKKFTAEDPLVQALHIQPNSLEKQIFNLAKTKKCFAIGNLIHEIKDFNQLKKLLSFQLDIITLIANQSKFDVPIAESVIDFFGKPPIPIDPKATIFAQRKIFWLYWTLKTQQDLQNIHVVVNKPLPFVSLVFPLNLIREFLIEFGYRAPQLEIGTIEKLQIILSLNFEELLERLFWVMAGHPTFLPELERVKEEMARIPKS